MMEVVVWASISVGGGGDASLCSPVVVLNLTASSASFSHDTESPRSETQGGPGAGWGIMRAVETARGRIRDSGRVVGSCLAGWWEAVWRAGDLGGGVAQCGDVTRSDSATRSDSRVPASTRAIWKPCRDSEGRSSEQGCNLHAARASRAKTLNLARGRLTSTVPAPTTSPRLSPHRHPPAALRRHLALRARWLARCAGVHRYLAARVRIACANENARSRATCVLGAPSTLGVLFWRPRDSGATPGFCPCTVRSTIPTPADRSRCSPGAVRLTLRSLELVLGPRPLSFSRSVVWIWRYRSQGAPSLRARR